MTVYVLRPWVHNASGLPEPGQLENAGFDSLDTAFTWAKAYRMLCRENNMGDRYSFSLRVHPPRPHEGYPFAMALAGRPIVRSWGGYLLLDVVNFSIARAR